MEDTSSKCSQNGSQESPKEEKEWTPNPRYWPFPNVYGVKTVIRSKKKKPPDLSDFPEATF
jgi:hypothetical protein